LFHLQDGSRQIETIAAVQVPAGVLASRHRLLTGWWLILAVTPFDELAFRWTLV
jgi:hypothetical protein